MKLVKILLLLSIFLKFYENKEIEIIRKLDETGTESIVSEETEFTSDSATTIPFIIPTHAPVPTSTPDEPIEPIINGTSTQPSYEFPDHQSDSISTDRTDRITTSPYTTPATAKPKLVLLGFGNFQMIRSPSPFVQIVEVVVITFRVYFKKYLFVGPLYPYMNFHLELTYSRYLRNLEEKLANCTKIKDDEDNIEYNCTIPDIEPNRTIESLASQNDYTFNDGTSDIPSSEDDQFQFYLSSYANSTGNNIEKQESSDISNTIVLQSASLTVPDPNKAYFEIKGYSTETINDNEVTFSFDENGDGKLKNVTCAVIPLGSGQYQFNCEADKSLNVNINNAMGKLSSGQNILLSFDEDAEGNTNDSLTVNNLSNFYGKQYSSSAGLSGGAIAGIVIACVCALIAVGLLAFCCKNKGNPPPMQETVMQIYSSNSNADNI